MPDNSPSPFYPNCELHIVT